MSKIKLLLDIAEDMDSLAASIKAFADSLKGAEESGEESTRFQEFPEIDDSDNPWVQVASDVQAKDVQPDKSPASEAKTAANTSQNNVTPAESENAEKKLTRPEIRIMLQTVPTEVAHQFLRECGEERLTNVKPEYFPILAEKVRNFNATQKTRNSVGVIGA